MIISRSKKTVYIAIPHTGSSFFFTFVAKHCFREWNLPEHDDGDWYLNAEYRKHSTLTEILSYATQELGIDAEELDTYTFFAVVKHPMDWMISDWDIGHRKLQYYDGLTDEELNNQLVNKAEVKWVLYLREEFNKSDALIDYLTSRCPANGPTLYEGYLCNDRGIQVHTLKFEDFAASYTTIADAFGLPAPDFNNKINVSNPHTADEACRYFTLGRFHTDYIKYGYSK